MPVRTWILAVAALGVLMPATFDAPTLAAEPTQAVRLCQNLTLYAAEHGADGLWRDIRVEDARAGARITYTATSARIGELRGAPSVLLEHGQAQVQGPDGQAQALSFEEFVLSSCPEAALLQSN